MKGNNTDKIKELEAKIRELEEMAGRKQIMVDYLETMIEVAKDELDFDIRENYERQQSKNSDNDQPK